MKNLYNFQLGKQRIIVENSYGLLKGKFKRFYFEQKNGDSGKNFKVVVGRMVIYHILLELY